MTSLSAAKKMISSGVYQFFVLTSRLARAGLLLKIWDRLWKKSCRIFKGPVWTAIHGRRVVVNYGYAYPVLMRRYRGLNAPLVELTYQVWKLAGRAIRVLDVGAAIGDTILLLHANLPEALSAFVCVEGDPEFFGYLSRNLSCLANGRLLNVLLSDREGPIPQLVRIHSGTASAQGTANSRATTLETEIVEDIDVIKIDVDGFDGRVLMGARDLLKRCHPAVIFEWHPILCQQTGNNWTDHFDVLIGCGYTKFVWYSKFGKFSHFTFNYSFDEVAALAEYCLGEIEADWHYDIIALHESIDIPLQSLARLEFAASRPSPY